MRAKMTEDERIFFDTRARKSVSFRSCWPAICVLLWLVWLPGCQEDNPPVPSEKSRGDLVDRAPVELSVLVVDDEPLAAAIESQWNARAEGSLTVGSLTVERATSPEILEILNGNRIQTDLIVYPVHWLGALVEREIVIPFPDDLANDPRFALPELLPMLRQHEVTWGPKMYASSLGSPSLVLYYRPDALEAAKLSPPETWDDYDRMAAALAEFSQREAAGSSGNVKYAVAEPLANGWAGQVLLARAAAYAKHRNNYSTLFRYKTMEPLIAGPPFIRALGQLVAAAQRAPTNALELTPGDVRQLFESGQCITAIAWPSMDAESELQPGMVESYAFAELPGASQVYHVQDEQWQDRVDGEETRVPLLGVAGRLLSVTSASRRTRAAWQAIAWLTSDELGLAISPQSIATGIFRTTQLENPRAWFGERTSLVTARQYGEVIAMLQTREAWLCSLRIPGRDRYMSVLDEAVQRAVRGEATPEEALRLAADEWRRISADLGIESQSRAYRRSIGLDF